MVSCTGPGWFFHPVHLLTKWEVTESKHKLHVHIHIHVHVRVHVHLHLRLRLRLRLRLHLRLRLRLHLHQHQHLHQHLHLHLAPTPSPAPAPAPAYTAYIIDIYMNYNKNSLQSVSKSSIWKNGFSPWDILSFQREFWIENKQNSGIRDPQFETLRIEIMRTDRRGENAKTTNHPPGHLPCHGRNR